MATVGRDILDVWEDDEDTWNRVLNEYFDTQQGCDDVSQYVYEMFETMAVANAKGGGEYGSENVGRIILDAEDFKDWNDKVSAYATIDEERYTRMHINPSGFKYPSLAEVHCDNLGDTVSNKMVTLGSSIILHELTYEPSSLGS